MNEVVQKYGLATLATEGCLQRGLLGHRFACYCRWRMAKKLIPHAGVAEVDLVHRAMHTLDSDISFK
jgi:hypothetical protein